MATTSAALGGYPCPCCGHLTFGEPPGSYEICSVCFWEDDAIQLRWPDWPGGANRPTLIEAQKIFQETGPVRNGWSPTSNLPPPISHSTPVDGPSTRPATPSSHETSRNEPPSDSTLLYWWRPTFWRKTSADARTSTDE